MLVATRSTMILNALMVLSISGHRAFAGTKTLEQKLLEIDQLRAAMNTPFDEVDKRGNALLEEYTGPEERGKIYFELVQVDGQSGFQRPQKILELINKALECPQQPLEKVRLYMYWGDALQVANRGVHDQELVVARRKTVMPYLQGLKETLQYHLAEARPDHPDLPPVHGYRPRPGMAPEQRRELERRNEEELAAYKMAMLQWDMILLRDGLVGQIASMYSRFPWASAEIRELAAKVLGDPEALDRLMSHVDKAVRERKEQLNWEAPLPSGISPALEAPVSDANVQAAAPVPRSRADAGQGTGSRDALRDSPIAASDGRRTLVLIGLVGLFITVTATVLRVRRPARRSAATEKN